MKNFKTTKLLFTILVLLITISASSQGEEAPAGFGDNVVDNNTTPAAPINDYIGVGVVLGSLYAFYLTKRKVKKSY